MKRIFVFVLALSMVISLFAISTAAAEADVWDGSIATAFESGTGTETDPYVIKSAAQLAFLAQQVKSGTRYTGEHFVLAGDINLAKLEWTPIGVYIKKDNPANSPFEGSFDGKGYTVSGIKVTSTESSIFCGLFGHVITEGYIKNFVIADSSIEASSNYTGALVGSLTAKEFSSVIVKEDVAVNGIASVGGIAGRIIGADAKYLINYATVTTAKVDSSCFGGGIAGGVGGGSTLSYAANYGEVSGIGAFHGGICGITGGNDAQGDLYNCVNFANVTYNGEKSWYVGGLTGCFAHTKGFDYKAENCYNLGQVIAAFAEAADGTITGQTRNDGITLTSVYTVATEGVELVGNVKKEATLNDVSIKTADEIKPLADALVATINANIVVPAVEPEATETVAPETSEAPVETTEPAPETTEPPVGPSTGDSFVIFAAIAVLSVVALAVVSKKREN